MMKITLEALVALARAESNPDLLAKIYSKIIRQHGGLWEPFNARFQAYFNNIYYTYDADSTLGWMFESLPLLVAEFDHSKGCASTCWRKVTQRLIRRESYANCRVASVRVPGNRAHMYSESSLEPLYDLDDDDDMYYEV